MNSTTRGKTKKIRFAGLAAVVMVVSGLLSPTTSEASPSHNRDSQAQKIALRDGYYQNRPFRKVSHWRGGKWQHARHKGRLGWWWVIGDVWHPYQRPVYPYPEPNTAPVVIVQQSPAPTVPAQVQTTPPSGSPSQGQSWYYCDAVRAYYPHINECPGGWRQVPATPPGY